MYYLLFTMEKNVSLSPLYNKSVEAIVLDFLRNCFKMKTSRSSFYEEKAVVSVVFINYIIHL